MVATAEADTPAEALANASLIAAAPDLLEALREALSYIETCARSEIVPREDGDGFCAAESAIAKAEGRS